MRLKEGRCCVFDLTAAYDTVRHRGLTCKLLRLLRLLPNRRMVRMIMELVRNRNFTLSTGVKVVQSACSEADYDA